MGRPADPERVARRAAYVREQVERLRELVSAMDEETFVAPGGWAAAGARYTLQTAIEALIDVAYHVCARRFSYAPPDARSAFRRLMESGAIARVQWPKVDGMVGLRNVLVHGYDAVDDVRLYRILRDELNDVTVLLQALEAAARVRPAIGNPGASGPSPSPPR